jgi:antitoxin component YwqK of YwqJK toxin-antitoxin module
MRFLLLLLWLITVHLGFSQDWNPSYKKGSLYFFSTYFTDSTLNQRMEGKHIEEHIGFRAVRIFENGMLINEQKWKNNIQTHDYHILQKSPFSANYEVWDSLGRINERWKLRETVDHHRILQISVYYPDGKIMLRFQYTQLTEKEQLEFHPEGYRPEDIDNDGFSPILVPTSISEEFNEKGQITSRKEYRFDPRPISEEERRIGRYTRNYPDGSPWEIHDYPNQNPYLGLHPFKIYSDNGKIQSELKFLDNGKALKSEYYNDGKLSSQQVITNYNTIPNQNKTSWYSPEGFCFRMRTENPQADTIEFERNLSQIYTYLHTQNQGITLITKRLPNGILLESKQILEDSTLIIEKYKNGILQIKIEQKNNVEKITEFESPSIRYEFQRINGKIEGRFVCFSQDSITAILQYENGICYRDNPPQPPIQLFTSSIDSIYQNGHRNANYYPFTLCTSDTTGQATTIKTALSWFDNDWKRNVRYHWSEVIENMPVAKINWARGQSYTIIEVIETLQSPTYLVYYDNGYREFLNRDKEWESLTPLVIQFKMDLMNQD